MAIKEPGPRGVNRQVLADHVYEALLIALMDGRLEAGTPVSIDGMARELDVSPTPVREALARLEATGMVRRTALRGYRVAPLFTAAELADLMDARLVIEPANAFMACGHADADLTAQLAQAIEDLKAAPRGPSFAEFRAYWEADERFHRLIAEHANASLLQSNLELDRRRAYTEVVVDTIAAVSVGIIDGVPMLDLPYVEDVRAETDMNVVVTGSGKFVEVQGTAEGAPFDRDELNKLLDLALLGTEQLAAIQRETLAEAP